MASRFNQIQQIPGYQALPIDALLDIGMAKDKEIQGTLDKSALKLQQFNNLQTVYSPDTEYTKQKIADANAQLQEIAKMDVTSPEGSAKFNNLIQSLSNDQGLIYGQKRTKAYQDTQEQIQALNKEGKYNDARALQWNLDSQGFDSRTDINDAANSKELISPTIIQPGYNINDDKFKAFNALKAHNLLNPNIYQDLGDFIMTNQGVDPTTILNAVSNTLSPQAQDQYIADFKYQKYQRGELDAFNKLSPQEQQRELSTYMYNDIAGFANTYKYDNPDLVKDADGKTASGSSGSKGSKNGAGYSEVPGTVTTVDGNVVADKLNFQITGWDKFKTAVATSGSEGFGDPEINKKLLTSTDDDGFIKPDKLDEFTKSHLEQFSTINPHMEGLYQKYKAGKASTLEKQTLFGGADSYYRNLPTHTESWFVPHVTTTGEPTAWDIPNWQVMNFIDKETGEVVSGKDINAKNGAPKEIGKYTGASGLEAMIVNPKDKAKAASGKEVHVPTGDGHYKEYIMLNPNNPTDEEESIFTVNNSTLTPQLKNTIGNTDYKITYVPKYQKDPDSYRIYNKSGKSLFINANDEIEISDKDMPISKEDAQRISKGLINPNAIQKTPPIEYAPQQNLPYIDTRKKPLSSTKFSGNSLAIKNNNPGNIRSVGGGFIKYDSMEEGLQGLRDYLTRAMTGKHKSYSPNDTILDFSKTYSPSSDNNDPVAKANSIAADLGIDINTPIKNLGDKLDAFIQAIIKTEDGNLYNQLYN